MLSLAELQQQFLRGLFAEQSTLEEHGGELAPAGRLELYRDNVFANLTDALKAVYPVACRLVGDEFFRHAARRYIRDYPSASGDIHDFGGRFGEFLQSFSGAAELVYLADTARLEWRVHESFHAAEHEPLALDRLAQVAPEDYEKLHFNLHPACRLLYSAYPVHRIWQVNQPEFEGEQGVDLAQGECRLLISRPQFEVAIAPLSRGGFSLLAALGSGEPFGQAVDRALQAEPRFDASAFVREHVQAGTLADFFLRQPEAGPAG